MISTSSSTPPGRRSTQPATLRQLTVSNVANEDVLEGVLQLSGNRRSRSRPNHVTALELVERLLDAVPRPFEVRDRAGPEDGPDHRRVLREPLLARRQPVET